MRNSHTKTAIFSLVLIWYSWPVLADSSGSDVFHHDHMWGAGWGFMGAGFMLLFWIGTILAIVVAVRWLASQSNGSEHSGESTALITLRDRLARGEIEIEEFEARKRTLEQ